MLYLTRKQGETIVINNNIEVTVTEIKGKSVKLGFVFPSNASILRKEIHDKVTQANLEASSSSEKDLLDAFLKDNK